MKRRFQFKFFEVAGVLFVCAVFYMALRLPMIPSDVFTGNPNSRVSKVFLYGKSAEKETTVVIEDALEVAEFNQMLQQAPNKHQFASGGRFSADLKLRSGRKIRVGAIVATDGDQLTLIPDDANPFHDPEFLTYSVRPFGRLKECLMRVYQARDQGALHR